jgi:hypothetical protein
MGTKWVIGVVAVVAMFAVGGIGFAAFTSSAYINGSATAGTLGPLYWTHGDPTGSESFDHCSAVIGTTFNSSDTLNFGASNLAPGDYCSYQAHLHNAGSIPANVYAEVTSTSGSFCGYTTLYDTFAGWSQPGETYGTSYGPLTISAGGALFYQAQMGFIPPAGNEWQGQTCTFTVTFTATAGSS